MKMVTVSNNEFFFYDEMQKSSVEVFYINKGNFTYWHFIFKPTTDDITTELPSVLTNPYYETEGESITCIDMADLLESVPTEIRQLIP